MIYALFMTLATLLLLLVILIFVVAFRVRFIVDSEHQNVNLTADWLSPFLKVTIAFASVDPIVIISLFHMVLYRQPMKGLLKKKPQGNNINMIKLAHPINVDVTASYGFRDPFTTGIACGIFSMATQYMGLQNIQQHPDFTAVREYIYVDASAKVNAGTIFFNFAKAKMTKN